MLFHGKALEVFTAAYQNIQNIDEDEDLEVGLDLHSVVSVQMFYSFSLYGNGLYYHV
jgi:hypothetical protein